MAVSCAIQANTVDRQDNKSQTEYAQFQGAADWQAHDQRALIEHIALLQAQGAHREALHIMQEAEHQIRMEDGIHSLKQVPLIEQSLLSLEALSAFTQRRERQERLLQLHQRHYGPDSVETVPALLALADEAHERFQRFTAGQDDDQPSRSSTHRHQRALQALDEAQGLYVDSINLLTAAQAFDHPLLIPLEERLLNTYYLQAWHGPFQFAQEEGPSRRSARPVTDNDALLQQTYRGGEHAHERILAYLRHQPDTTVGTYASALAARGDWHMLFGHKNAALDSYAEAEDMLRASNAPRDLAMSILQPAHALSTRPGTRFQRLQEERIEEDSQPSPHYIDVAFHINRSGQPTRVRRLGSSPGTSPALATALLKQARQSRFRPHISDGKAINSDEVRLRFYASETMARRW